MTRGTGLIGLLFLCVGGCVTPGGGSTSTGHAKSDLFPRVRFRTNHGDIVVELDTKRAPRTVINFVRYVREKYYDGLTFHRVVRGRLIQGGRYTPDMKQRRKGLHVGIGNEAGNGLTDVRGSIAMQRRIGRQHPTTTQFFINITDNDSLDDVKNGYYGVFGHVVEGMDVVDEIGRTAVGPHPDYAAGLSAAVPQEPVVIKQVRLVSRFDQKKAEQVIRDQQEAIRRAAAEAETSKVRQRQEAIEKFEKQCGQKMTTTQSGLMYCDVRKGVGAPPTLEDTVIMNFHGTLLDGTELENTFLDPEPPTKQVSSLIKGLQEAIMTMGEGSKRMVIVPPDLAFGVEGVTSRIPGNATILFDLELLEIK